MNICDKNDAENVEIDTETGGQKIGNGAWKLDNGAWKPENGSQEAGRQKIVL